MIEYVAIIAFVLSPLWIYTVLLSIECGASLLAIAPGLFGKEIDARSYISPAWEATNVFLVVTIIACIAFFPGALHVWGTALVVPLFFFLAIMGTRALGMLLCFYSERAGTFARWLLFVPSMLAPGVLSGGIVAFFITGTTRISAASVAMGLLATAVMLALSLFFFAHMRFRTSRTLRAFLTALAAYGLVFYLAAFTFLPVIVFPDTTIFSTFTDPGSARLLLCVFAAGFALIAPALWLMYRMATRGMRRTARG